MISTATISNNINTRIRTGVDTESATIKNMKVEDAARELGKSVQYVRIRTTKGFPKVWNSTNNKWE